MKRLVMIICSAAFLTVHTARAQQTVNPNALIARARKAKAAGDGVSALRDFTEAICALRLAGTPEEKITPYLVERDRLAAEIISQVATVSSQQKRIIALQEAIAKKMDEVVQLDKDIQSRVKKNENRIKDIETDLVDAVR